MILRNCFLTAALFAVGIVFAFAEEPIDEDTFRETTYSFDNSTAAEDLNTNSLSFSKTAGNEAGDSTLFEHIGVDETGNEPNDYTIGYTIGGITPVFHEDSESADPDENESLPIFDFSVSYYDSITDEIGFTARADVENPLVFSEVFAEAPNNSQLPNQETFALLFFDKQIFTSAHNWGQILSGGYYFGETEEESAFLSFSSMMTIPFAILSVGLSIGFLLIMFTSITGNKTNI